MAQLTEQELEQAGAQAEDLAASIRSRGDSIAVVFEQLDHVVAGIEDRGYDPEDLLPPDAEEGLGFSLRTKRDGKTLWQVIALAGRDNLCDAESEVRQRLSAGGAQASAGSIVGGVFLTLGLSPLAVPVAVAIAAVILAIGIKGLCEWLSNPVDEPGPA